MVDIIPLEDSELCKVLKTACGTDANMRFIFEPYIASDGEAVLGICLEGAMKGLALKVLKIGENVTHVVPDYVRTMQVHAIEGNTLQVPVGTKLVLSVGQSCNEEGRCETIGIAFDVNTGAALMMELLISGVTPKARSQLKKAVLPSGTILNRDMTVRAVCAWLDKQNTIHAPSYSVNQLVWCEMPSSASSKSSSRNQTRVFYYVDLSDKMRKKPCGNANKAIEIMEQFCKSNFFKDMRDNGDAYEIL